MTELIEFPRHLSQHVGGYVLTPDRLDTYVPIGNAAMDDRTFIEWDKDDVDALRMMKVDVLALGMLTCIRKCFDLIDEHKGERWELADRPGGRPQGCYEMLCRGESPRRVSGREPRADEHAAAPETADILRSRHRSRDRAARADPGRHGASVSAGGGTASREGYRILRRPRGRPTRTSCYKVLRKTLGVPLFQEQAMRIAIEAARISRRRRPMACAARWRRSAMSAPSAISKRR